MRTIIRCLLLLAIVFFIAESTTTKQRTLLAQIEGKVIQEEAKLQEGLDVAQESTLISAVAEGNWQEVERICTDWKARQPKSLIATWLLSAAFIEQNKMKQERMLSIELDLFEEKRWKEAITFAERMVKAHSGSAIAWTLLSNAQIWARMNKEALKNANKAVLLDEKCALAWYNKSVALGKIGRYEEAIKCLDKAIKINPNYAQAWVNKGGVLQGLKRYEEAIKHFDKAIEINPDFVEAWEGKGWALGAMGRHEEAIKCLDKAIGINPNDYYAWVNKGKALENMGRYEEAIKCYDKAIEINSSDPRVWLGKATVLRQLKRYEEAIKCLDKVIQINPNLAEVWYVKGGMLYELKRYKEAIKYLDKGIEINPNDAMVWFSKGMALYKLKHYKEAKESFKKAEELGLLLARQMLEQVEREEAETIVIAEDSTSAYPWKGTGGLEYVGGLHLSSSYMGVFVKDNYAYVASGWGLEIFDVSDPASPHKLGETPTPGGKAAGIYISGDRAYITDYKGLQIIDISDKTNPRLIGSMDTQSYAEEVYVSGDYAYVASAYGGLHVVDVSDESNPRLIRRFDTGDYARSVCGNGDYIYLADDREGLLVIDIHDRRTPRVTSKVEALEEARRVYVRGEYAYVVGYAREVTEQGRRIRRNLLQIVDISDKVNPEVMGSVVIPGSIGQQAGISVSGSYAYVVGRYALHAVDISDKSSPQITDSIAIEGGDIMGAYVSGNYAYVAAPDSGLLIVDISQEKKGGLHIVGHVGSSYLSSNVGVFVKDNAGTPPRVSALGRSSSYVGMFVKDNYAYVASGWGLEIFDVSDPASPHKLGEISTPGGRTAGIYISGDRAYIVHHKGLMKPRPVIRTASSKETSVLQIIDISDKTNPRMIGSMDTRSYARAVYVSGDYVYVTAAFRPPLGSELRHRSRLLAVDVSDESNPRLISRFDTPHNAHSVCGSGDHIYLADDREGLLVLDIHDRSNPQVISKVETPAKHAYVRGEYAYIVGYARGVVLLHVVDISDKVNPKVMGSVAIPGAFPGGVWGRKPSCQGICVSGNYAYVVGRDALHAVDISDKSNPQITDGVAIEGGDTVGVYVSGNYAYVAAPDSGLLIVDISQEKKGGLNIVGSISTPKSKEAPFSRVDVSGDYAYVVDPEGLLVIDVSDKTTPKITGRVDVAQQFRSDVKVSGDYAYITARNHMHIVDVSSKSSPRIVGSVQTGNQKHIYVSGNYAYMTKGMFGSGFTIVDISDKSHPQISGRFGGYREKPLEGIHVDGRYAYVAGDVTPYLTEKDRRDRYGLLVLDIQDRSKPEVIGAIRTPGSSSRRPEVVCVKDEYAYVAGQDRDFQVIDISDKANPRLVGHIEHGSVGRSRSITDIHVVGDYAYVTERGSGIWQALLVVDISSPSNPRIVAAMGTPGPATGVSVSGDYIFVADSYALSIFQFQNKLKR